MIRLVLQGRDYVPNCVINAPVHMICGNSTLLMPSAIPFSPNMVYGGLEQQLRQYSVNFRRRHSLKMQHCPLLIRVDAATNKPRCQALPHCI